MFITIENTEPKDQLDYGKIIVLDNEVYLITQNDEELDAYPIALVYLNPRVGGVRIAKVFKDYNELWDWTRYATSRNVVEPINIHLKLEGVF